MEETKARELLRHIATDTRTTLNKMATEKGVSFDNTVDDATVLRKLLEITGVEKVFAEHGATSLIDDLNRLLSTE